MRDGGIGLTILLVTRVGVGASNQRGVRSREVSDRARDQVWNQRTISYGIYNACAVMSRAEDMYVSIR